MKPFMRAAVAALVLACSAAAEAETVRWAVATNGRFGSTVEYPSSVFTQRLETSINGATDAWSTSDGKATFSIGGTWRSNLGTPQEQARVVAGQDGQEIDYVQATPRFYVVSGTQRGVVFYRRCNYPKSADGIVDCLTIRYPAAETKWWDPIVTRMSRSLHGVHIGIGEFRVP